MSGRLIELPYKGTPEERIRTVKDLGCLKTDNLGLAIKYTHPSLHARFGLPSCYHPEMFTLLGLRERSISGLARYLQEKFSEVYGDYYPTKLWHATKRALVGCERYDGQIPIEDYNRRTTDLLKAMASHPESRDRSIQGVKSQGRVPLEEAEIELIRDHYKTHTALQIVGLISTKLGKDRTRSSIDNICRKHIGGSCLSRANLPSRIVVLNGNETTVLSASVTVNGLCKARKRTDHIIKTTEVINGLLIKGGYMMEISTNSMSKLLSKARQPTVLS